MAGLLTQPGAAAAAAADGLFTGVRPEPSGHGAPLCSMVIDAEEDFDWDQPVRNTQYSTECMRHTGDLLEIVLAYGVRPTYLMTYPVLANADVVRTIRRQYDRGECDMGVQLHPWVTPPFDGPSRQSSYLGNLDAAIEERKLVALLAKFREAFGRDAVTFRAGRYGLSHSTTRLLERYGFEVDTSLAPRTDFTDAGGPDFSDYDCTTFWFGSERRLLEVPLCRSLVGWSGRLAPAVYALGATAALSRFRAGSVLSRTGCAERITLSPEGNDHAAMRRLLQRRRSAGQRVFSLSFHSSSLWPGRNPYVQTRRDLHVFYDRMSEILDTMAGTGFRFAALGELPGLLGGPP